MIFKKLRWIFKRHPFLYLTRFRLLSKNSSPSDIADCTYNVTNKKSDIPAFFYDVNTKMLKDFKGETDLDLVKHMALWLNAHIKGGPGLSEPSDQALQLMLDGKGGVCSDMAQVFNNFCVLNEIQVREWGTTSAPFNRDYGGHSFNEVYCRELEKWVLVDVSWGMLFFRNNDIPLSVLEVYTPQRSNRAIQYRSFLPNNVLLPENVNKNYLNADIIPFLICNYRTKTYDTVLKVARPVIPVFFIHFFVYLLGKSYHYRFPLDDYRKIFS